MSTNDKESELSLSIIVTVVGGRELVRRCLEALCAQVNFAEAEIIVPYDRWSREVGELAANYPSVYFHLIDYLGAAETKTVTSHAHRLYDRRRAAGLSLARGPIVAIIEDYALPAADWCRQILLAHEQPHAVIGGAIENAVDRPLNRALYYCDFGRYGRPFAAGAVNFVSDVNVSYKREALIPIRDVWRTAYHETTLHWSLQSQGQALFLDPRIVVFEHRPKISLGTAMRERVEWGRVFAETRVATCNTLQRIGYAIGTVFLPALLSLRVFRHMMRQRCSLWKMVQTTPLAVLLLVGWSYGELAGYLSGEIQEEVSLGEGVSEI